MTMMETRRIPVNELGHESPAAMAMNAGVGLQQTRGAFTTAMAVQRPRSLKEVQRRVEEEADLAGEDFFYGWGNGKDRIEGPSIDAALAVARCYGNCAVEQLPIQETPNSWIFTAAFVDFETGFTLARQFRQSKNWKVHGKHDEDRKADMRFQIGQSKAIRNVVANALKPMVNKAVERAKGGVKQKIDKFIAEKGIVEAINLMLKSLAKHGVTEERVLAKMEVADRKALTAENLVTLRGDLSALDAGREWPDELFPDPNATTDDAPKSEGAASLNEKLKQPQGQTTEPKEQQPTDKGEQKGEAAAFTVPPGNFTGRFVKDADGAWGELCTLANKATGAAGDDLAALVDRFVMQQTPDHREEPYGRNDLTNKVIRDLMRENGRKASAEDWNSLITE